MVNNNNQVIMSPITSPTPTDQSLWSSVPWTSVTSPSSSPSGKTIGFWKKFVPYLVGGLSLQTLDVWIPTPPAATSSNATLPDASTPLNQLTRDNGHWIVYIHGGAWRDPAVDSTSFSAAATAILESIDGGKKDADERKGKTKIAGLASINYRLSPHASYPAPDDPSRQARHPDHIHDVLAGLSFLQRLWSPPSSSSPKSKKEVDYVLAGHSCGATLAFQAVMDPSRWTPNATTEQMAEISKPSVVVGLNGLYDLAGFIANPPPGEHAQWRDMYELFTRAAFGDDEKTWRDVCPVTAEGDWVGEWVDDVVDGKGGGKEGGKKKKKVKAVLVQSREDTLVPYEQLEAMRQRLLVEEKKEGVEVVEREAGLDHNQMWGQPGRMVEILEEAVGWL